MTDFKADNQALQEICLEKAREYMPLNPIYQLLVKAIQKSIKPEAVRPTPSLYSLILARDLGFADDQRAWQITLAGSFFYSAADLLDDIQDQDLSHPVLESTSPAQALNIVNILLMLSFELLTRVDLPASQRLKLNSLFQNMALTMSIGQYFDLDTTNNRALNVAPQEIVLRKAGAEFGCFLAAYPLVLDWDPLPYQILGEKIGALIQVFTDYYDIWVLPSKFSVSDDLKVLKNSYPIYLARQDLQWQNQIELALAGQNNSPYKQFELRRLLAKTQAIEGFETYFAETRQAIQAHLQNLPPLPTVQTLITEDWQACETLLAALRELREHTQNAAIQLERPDCQKAQIMALAYLNQIHDHRDCWEVHRWGFLGKPELIGNLFNPLLVLETLLEAGQDIRADFQRLIELRAEEGWYYYTNSKDIPTDTDDLGQILHMAGALGIQAPEIFEKPLDLLLDNIADLGYCPTWLCDEKIHFRHEVDKRWFGNHCFAVMANLYYGLAVYDLKLYSALIQEGIAYILSRFEQHNCQWPVTNYPSYLYTAYLVARLLKKTGHASPILSELSKRILASQTLDGSFEKKAQETAFALLFFCHCPELIEADALEKGIRYLIARQNYDGSWSGEPFFIRAGQEAAFEVFQHPKLTTAFCTRALIGAQEVLESCF